MSRPLGVAVAATLAVAVLAPGVPAHAEGTSATTTGISVGPDGSPVAQGAEAPSISADGRYVAFQSFAKTLVPGDTNRSIDIFVRDRQTGAVERVSTDSAGRQGDKDSEDPAISADGRFVAFASASTNLVPDDTNRWEDVFVHDRQTGSTERVSLGIDGVQGDWDSFSPGLSADGRFVVFESVASNLVAGDKNKVHDAFVVDRQTGRTERVSVSTYGREATEIVAQSSISADGRYVSFVTLSPNLSLEPDNNHASDVFVRDRYTRVTSRVSVMADGSESPQTSLVARISADGRHVVFESDGNLVPEDTNNRPDVYARDLNTGALTWASREAFLAPTERPASTPTLRPAISADGRYVAFTSGQHGLVAGDTNGEWDVFVRDVLTGGIERVSVAYDGAQPTQGSEDPVISADGRFVAFASYATNLLGDGDDDVNYTPNVFLRDRGN